ncbi:hypothetical protein ACSBR1_032336 [Camellia fascicularis]
MKKSLSLWRQPKVGRLEDAKEVIRNLWGPSEVNKAIEEFQSVNRNDDLESRWLELLEQPHSRGCIKATSMFLVVYAISSPIDEELGHNLSILGTVLYIFTFAIGSGPVTSIIIPELSSSRMRGKIMGFSFSVHWEIIEVILMLNSKSVAFTRSSK